MSKTHISSFAVACAAQALTFKLSERQPVSSDALCQYARTLQDAALAIRDLSRDLRAAREEIEALRDAALPTDPAARRAVAWLPKWLGGGV